MMSEIIIVIVQFWELSLHALTSVLFANIHVKKFILSKLSLSMKLRLSIIDYFLMYNRQANHAQKMQYTVDYFELEYNLFNGYLSYYLDCHEYHRKVDTNWFISEYVYLSLTWNVNRS